MVGEEGQVHLGYDGKAAVEVHNADKRVDTSGLVNTPAFASGLATAESALTQALCFLHDPHLFMLQLLGFEDRQFTPTALGKVHPKALCVARYLENALLLVPADG